MTRLTVSTTRFSHATLGVALMALGVAAMMFSAFGLGMTWVHEWMLERVGRGLTRYLTGLDSAMGLA